MHYSCSRSKTYILTILSCLSISTISLAADIVVSGTVENQSYDQNAQNLIIDESGHISGTVTSSYAGSSIIVNASGSNGINANSSTAITNVSNININSGLVESKNIFAIKHLLDEDLVINVGKDGAIKGKTFVIFSYATKNNNYWLNINNKGLITSQYPISLQNRNLNLINSGTITSDKDKNSLIAYTISNDENVTQIITNESSGIINGSVYTIAKENALLTNKGYISGDIGVSGTTSKSIQIVNDGGSIGKSDNIRSISLSTGEKSSFTLINGVVNANMDVGLENRSPLTESGSLMGVKQVVDLKGGTFNGNINFITGASVNVGATDFNGTLQSTYSSRYSADRGAININSTANLDSGMNLGGVDGVTYINVKADSEGNVAKATYSGANMKSEYLNIESGSTLNLASDLAVEGLKSANISGTLDFGENNRVFTGNVTGTGTGTLSLNSGNHIIDGNLTLVNGDTLDIKAKSNAIGKITVNGAANISSGVGLNIDTFNAYSYLTNGYSTAIIDGGAGSSITPIPSSKISAHSIDTNKYEVMTFTTSASEDGTDLMLNINRSSLEQAIENNGDYKDIGNTLIELKPQDSQAITSATLSTVNASNNLVENRVSGYHNSYLSTKNNKSSLAYSSATSYRSEPLKSKTLYKLKKGLESSNQVTGISSGDTPLKNIELWGRAFGSTADQKNINGSGYNSRSIGFSLGADKKLSKDLMIGASLTKSESTISAKSSNKVTNVESYQANIYSSKFFGKYFASAILGFAWNDNKSTRVISDASLVAKAKYNSYSYVSKVAAGAVYNNISNSGFNLIPEISTTFVNSKTNSYSESQAGNLNLAVKRNYSEYLEARAKIGIEYKATRLNKISKILKNQIHFKPKLMASYGYNFLNEKQSTVSNFIGQSTTFNTISEKISPSSVRIGGSLLFQDTDSSEISFDYVNERRSGYSSHFGGVKVGFKF